MTTSDKCFIEVMLDMLMELFPNNTIQHYFQQFLELDLTYTFEQVYNVFVGKVMPMEDYELLSKEIEYSLLIND